MKINFKLFAILVFSLLFADVSAQTKKKVIVKKVAPKEETVTSSSMVKEIKFRPLGLLFKTANLSGEFEVADNIGLEVGAGYNWGFPFGNLLRSFNTDGLELKTTGLTVNSNGRYYISPSDKKLDKFYTGAYLKYNSTNLTANDGIDVTTAKTSCLALGFLGGYKIVSKDNMITFDFTMGVGRALFYKLNIDGNNITEEGLSTTPVDGILAFSVGYRF
jgi:hypothetical protein